MSMGNAINLIAFALVCLLLMTLPFVPAFKEWRYPSDVAALPVLPDYTSEIEHFAQRLRADAAARLGLGPSTGYEDFDFVTGAVADMAWGKAQKRLIARHSLVIEESIYIDEPVYVEGDVRTTARTSFSALYATGNIDLSAENEVHDWAHADGLLRLGPGSIALRRISAGTAIEVGNEAWFERLQAPVLRFGMPTGHAPQPAQAEPVPASYADLPNAIQQTPSLFLIRGDCVLADAKVYRGSLIVTGFLSLGEATTVIGDIKARKGMSIGQDASIEGAVTCDKGIYVSKDVRAAGPVMSESDIFIGASAVIGLIDAQTTVSARNIIVENGVTVHGAVWAHEVGIVKPA